MFNKDTPVEYLKEIYWFSHFLFFCSAILVVIFIQPVHLQEDFTIVKFNTMMLISLGCFLLLNYLFYKTSQEGFDSRNYTYRVLYAVVLSFFTLSFVSIFNVDMDKLVYIVPIVLISLTSGPYLGIISSLLFSANSALHNSKLALDDIPIFLCFIIIAWIVGQMSNANRDYAIKLEKERDFLKSLIQTFSEGVLISDSRGKIILCNKQIEHILKKEQKELIGQKEATLWQSFSVPNDKLDTNAINMEVENQGNTYLVSRFILKNSREETNSFVTVINNITELQQQKVKMQRLETLSVIGELAAGAAHEIRNPLTTVSGFLQLLQAKGETGDYNKLYDFANAELARINVIITSMLDLAKTEKGELKSININEIINDVWQLYTYAGTLKGINYNKNLADNVLPFMGSVQQIKQLLLNILQNAERACGSHDTITIKTYSASQYTFIEIQDTGKGILPEHLHKIMHPFFTTEPNGTGLGLAICNRIIQDNYGDIQVASEPGVGTTFTIMFPVIS